MRSRRELLASLAGVGCGACLGLWPGGAMEGAQDAPGRQVGGGSDDLDAPSRPARWVKTLPDGWVRCGLCPNECRISEGERGTCGVRENRRGKLLTLVHSRPCSVAVDPIEKKPFFHVLPGATALSLATAGCNLACKACQNWEIAQARPEQVASRTLPPEGVIETARSRGARVVACTYTEPVVFAEYVFDIAAAGRKQGIRTVVVSNGYVQEEPLRDLASVLTAYKVDLKGFRAPFYRDHTGGELRHVLDTLRRLVKHGLWTEIVVLVIPTLNDSPAEIRDLARFVRNELGTGVPVHFTRFHPAYRLANLPPTPVATLERSREIALEEGLPFSYVGNVPGHPGESTYCPGCRTRLVRRAGMATLENRIVRGTCPDCAARIPGIWS